MEEIRLPPFESSRLSEHMKQYAETLMKRMDEHFDNLMKGNKGWINVDMRAPPNDCCVLLAIYDSRVRVEMFFLDMGYRINDIWYYSHDGSKIGGKGKRVTHWMLLPDEPKKEDL